MLYSFILALNMILSLLGLYFLFHIIISSLLIKGKASHRIVVVAYEDDEELFDKIYRAHMQINMHCFSKLQPVYVIDCGLTPSTKTALLSYFSAYGQIIFLNKDDAADILCELTD